MTNLSGEEILLCSFEGEESDFVRLNKNRVRQAGNVQQRVMSLDLIAGRRHASGYCTLQGNLDQDLAQLKTLMETLRSQRAHLPEDPYLNFAYEVHHSEKIHDNELPESGAAVDQIISAAEGMDLVGIFASGTIYKGFANSLGQRNWHSSNTFNFDWSCYYQQDKAVKNKYAGFNWDTDRLKTKMTDMREQLNIVSRPSKTMTPGRYRVYLAPAALLDIIDMMSWGGFGLKSHRTAQTPLIKMVKDGKRLHAGVTLIEDHGHGLEPNFTGSGFIKPDRVILIKQGHYSDCLISPRSAMEYKEPINSGSEYPSSLNMSGGQLKQEEILTQLDTGLYINNLWYCNFSDRNNCQITGMTRFACFWVENGNIQATTNVMRFDETVYNILGDHLLGITQDREFIFNPGTYEQRSTGSYLLPGVLVEDFTFTL